MMGDQRHILVAIRDGSRRQGQNGGSDQRDSLAQICNRYLPLDVTAKIISSDGAIERSAFRHSTAPYWRDFDPAAPRILLKLSLAPEILAKAPPLHVAAALAGHALTIADHVLADALCWPYAQIITSVAQMRAAMERLSLGQDAPVLQFVRMTVRPDATLTSTGLYYFCGQEIRLRAIGQLSAAGLVRRACRIAADAMLNGPYEKAATVTGLAVGENLEIRPESRGIWTRKPQWLSVQCDVRGAALSETDL